MHGNSELIAGTIERFIRTEFRVSDRDPGFRQDTHLCDAGYVDSAGVVELIAFIESTFKIVLTDEDIFDEEFTSVAGIGCIVGRRLYESTTAVETAGSMAPSDASDVADRVGVQ